jgi:uncharacterized small protein (DUF1192 family)
MPEIPQLVAAIDNRLAELTAEISALDAAKAALSAPGAGGQPPAVTTDANATRSPRRAARRRLPAPPRQPEPASRRGASGRVDAARKPGRVVTPQRSTRKRATTGARPQSAGGAVGAETLERLLADATAGLSANAIAKHAHAGYARTLKLLHELEAAGRVRQSGSRRSSVWQLITDEERIAARAAELERLRSAPTRRRGTARAA